VAAEFFEVAIGSDQNRLLQYGQRRREAIYVGDFMARLEFSSFEGLRQIDGNEFQWKARKTS
jgi:hypothetical protein